MNSPSKLSKDSLKQLYHEMKHRIRMALSLIGNIDTTKPQPRLEENVVHTLSKLIHGIMINARTEDENQYRDSIIEIAEWMNSACQKDFINLHNYQNPNALFLIKKGAEILHSFFHRDLRRKHMSSDEREIHQKFMLSLKVLPDPRPVAVAPDETDLVMVDLLKSS